MSGYSAKRHAHIALYRGGRCRGRADSSSAQRHRVSRVPVFLKRKRGAEAPLFHYPPVGLADLSPKATH